MDWGTVERLAERRLFVTFTLGLAPHRSPPPRVVRVLDQLRRHIAAMHSAGVRLICGSDAGIAPSNPHGVLPYGAVTLAGIDLTNAEALEAVTSIAAEACGLRDRKGRVAPGLDADLLAVEGDPLRDIGSLLHVAAVFRRGIRVR